METKIILMILMALWILPWKGWALWLAVKRNEKIWFIVLLVLNTLAILEIIYIFAIAKRSSTKEVSDNPFDKKEIMNDDEDKEEQEDESEEKESTKEEADKDLKNE